MTVVFPDPLWRVSDASGQSTERLVQTDYLRYASHHNECLLGTGRHMSSMSSVRKVVDVCARNIAR